MSIFSPHKRSFIEAKIANIISIILIWSIFVLSIFLIAINNSEYSKYAYQLKSLNVIFIFIYFFVNLINRIYLMPNAEKIRRIDFIDNSFGTTHSQTPSNEYFSNDKVDPGFYKMAVNLFENIFFTVNISKKMLWKKIIILLILILVFLISACYGLNNLFWAYSFFQFLFSISIAGSFAYFLKYLLINERCLNDIEILFKINNKNSKEFYSFLIKIYSDYETNILQNMVLSDSKLFEKYNKNLSEEWEIIKLRYKI